MVSAGTVTSDLNSVMTSLTEYRTNLDTVSSSWKGLSYDNLSTKADEFLNEYKSSIENQMNAFASAVTAYEEYINEKRSYESAMASYNSAVSQKDTNADSLLAEANKHKENMERLKREIESLLGQASSPTLSATPIGTSSTAPAVDLSKTTVVPTVSTNETIQAAITKGYEIANDDSHGYSQKRRWGNPDYDCSSFVITCWENAGTGVKEAGATYTGNMKESFLSTGLFEWIPGDPSVEDLKPGDILLNPGSHTEMYIGDGKMIGARHGDRDGKGGDSSGSEICVTDLARKWTGILRYTGGNGSQNTANA